MERYYGRPPYRLALVHGGPGANGEMAEPARALAAVTGVLEPLQTAATVDGQVEELKESLMQHAAEPVVLLGHSWGAWLAGLLTARHPELVRKLILVGSGPFEEKYVKSIETARMNRLTSEERDEINRLMPIIDGPDSPERQAAFARFGALFGRTDAYAPLPDSPDDAVELREDLYQSVWPEAAELRRSGRLLREFAAIRGPVVAIHGDYDPHPVDGVGIPLQAVLPDFRMVVLPHCGHTPWRERDARDAFLQQVRREL